MNEAEIKENTTAKICESCGENFVCGAKAEKCWCFDVDLSDATLAKLQDDFKNCLCGECLKNYGEKEK